MAHYSDPAEGWDDVHFGDRVKITGVSLDDDLGPVPKDAEGIVEWKTPDELTLEWQRGIWQNRGNIRIEKL